MKDSRGHHLRWGIGHGAVHECVMGGDGIIVLYALGCQSSWTIMQREGGRATETRDFRCFLSGNGCFVLQYRGTHSVCLSLTYAETMGPDHEEQEDT